MTPPLNARRLTLQGLVQGLGVRPAVYRLASELQLAGHVRNTSAGVEVVVEGLPEKVADFVERLPVMLPRGVRLDDLASAETEMTGADEFIIIRYQTDGPLATRVPRDVAVCDECLREINDNGDRRFRYSLTSCTQCGPRYSILRAMPYERPDTTMAEFTFCAPCNAEYHSPNSRRFHAQTNACATCGPAVWTVDAECRQSGVGEDALRFAGQVLRCGKILAIKGVGGYQLLVDATNEQAVQRLRTRKHRPAKPLAIMIGSLAEARTVAFIDETERDALCSPTNPIVLLRARSGTNVCGSIHPGLDSVGVMLPTTPLHALLAADFEKPLVCTSANDDGNPLVYDTSEAETQLAGVCDAWLHHDRVIARSIDDSVVRVIAGRSVTFRLARGLAPLPLELPSSEPVLALGGHMKSAAAWSNGQQAVLGPHVGEMQSLTSRERLVLQLDAWQSLYRFQPGRIVHDLHPDYFTSHLAEAQLLPTLAVQHHHAHVVAGMLEHGWLDRAILGVSWDGTGFGADGTIWGGEFLVTTANGFHRLARIRPYRLPGGQACVYEPWRTAISVMADSVASNELERTLTESKLTEDANYLLQMLRAKINAPLTSSAGRLFDAAAHIILGIDRVQYEGQAPMLLESAADPGAVGEYEIPLIRSPDKRKNIAELDWRPLIVAMLTDRHRRASPGEMAMRFHRAMAAGIVSVCRLRTDLPIVLTGGVFQNRLLTELVDQMLQSHPQPVGLPGAIPPGDGGLAAGQLAVALANTEKQ